MNFSSFFYISYFPTILNVKSFDNSWDNLYILCLLLIMMFINKNHASFHLWWKEDLVKHQKVSKYYDHHCQKNILLFFMSLSTALIVKNIHILIGIYLVFLEKHLRQILNSILIRNLVLKEKIGKASKVNLTTFL